MVRPQTPSDREARPGRESRPDLLVIGAGVAGLTTALCAGVRGMSATVFERAPELRWQGGGLVLCSNAMLVLDRLGLADAIVAKGRPLRELVFLDREGDLLFDIPVAELGSEVGAPCVAIQRAELMGTLRNALSEQTSIRFGRVLEAVDQTPDGVTARFEDGAEAEGSALVGADGVFSVVRRLTWGDADLDEVGQVAWIGLAQHVPRELAGGAGIGVVGSDTRFWAAAAGQGTTAWYAILPTPQPSPPSRRVLRDIYRDWPSWITDVIDASDESALVEAPLRDRVPSDDWGVGRVTLVGDAAQPVTPDLAQGACQAIEGAALLVDSFRADRSAEQSLREYEDDRKPRVAGVRHLCRLVALASQSPNDVEYRLRSLAARLLPRSFTEEQMLWLFDRPAPELRPLEAMS